MNKYLIEFLGTMFLIFVILVTDNWLAIGAALAIAILLGGGVFNPAGAIALYSNGKLQKNDVLPYIIAQILGALAAFFAYKNYVNRT